MEKRIGCRIREEDLPCQAGKILRRRMGLTEAQIRSAKFRKDGICVNGRRARVTQQLGAGDRLEVLLEEGEASPDLVPAYGKLDILYEDEDLLAVNKPANLPVHPAHGHYDDTLSNLVLGYYEQTGQKAGVHPIGRLDKETSGIVIFAKHRVAAARLSSRMENKLENKTGNRIENWTKNGTGCKSGNKIECNLENSMANRTGIRIERRTEDKTGNRTENIIDNVIENITENITENIEGEVLTEKSIQKEYLALVKGTPCPGQGWILLPLAADPSDLNRMRVQQDGREARTWYQVLQSREEQSLIRLRLETGRTHQIRVHMAALGHPLLGDRIYGDSCREEQEKIQRAALHCFLAEIVHPFTGERLRLEAPVPEDMRQLIGKTAFL